MKRTLILLLLSALITPVFGQSNPIDEMFDKYSGMDGFTTIYISSKMFSLIARADMEDEELQEMMNNLKSIRILTVDDDSTSTVKVNFYKELERNLDFSRYEELMVVKDGSKDLKFLIKEKGRKIEELLMIGGGNDGGNILLSIKGDLSLQNISDISSKIGIDELKGIENSQNKKKYD
jgi:hypothetical protein